MSRYTFVVLLALIVTASVSAQTEFDVGEMNISLQSGVITSLTDSAGTVYADAPETRGRAALRLLSGDRTPEPGQDADGDAELPLEIAYSKLADDKPGAMKLNLAAGDGNRDLIVTQSGSSDPGLHGVQWGVTGIPLSYNIIVPGRSGIKLDRDIPGTYYNFQYPIAWEAQFVIIEGAGKGFWVWAEDPDGAYKNLRVWKRKDCWDLAFETQNNAPFEDKSQIESVRWRLALYEGDWRVPARQYRQWAQDAWNLTKLEDQQPAWVKDIRTLIICGMDLNVLDEMASTFDPAQTILYVPSWRRDGYDKNYPDYTALPELAPFMERAHGYGFKVMLHVNYFGCDPKNEEYARFEPFHTRDPFNKEKLWWVPPSELKKPDKEPTIKFAYINPACEAWRDLFVSRMKELCEKYDVDSLHLDQTLCIWNDANGLIDGMTMLEGNIAEHRQLREALPNVALSGEGLNEAAFRHEAFAQRHAWGINHSEGTWDRTYLLRAHPVSSYLLRPYTIINGYLGMTSPSNDQLYAAWMQAYINWGVIPTFSNPSLGTLREPAGFARQLLDEIRFVQSERVDPDMDGQWDAETIFPYLTADGEPVRYVRDGGFALVAGDDQTHTISRTITGVSEVTGPGSIPGWLAYDEKRIFGLKSDAWYPLVEEDRDHSVFHVTSVPPEVRVARVTAGEELAVIATADDERVVGWISDMLGDARCGYTVFGGEGEEVDGALTDAESGASFQTQSRELISLHPPWKGLRNNEETGVLEARGTGLVYAILEVDLPADGQLDFISEVFMGDGSVGEGKTDGVVFSVNVTDGEKTAEAKVHAKTTEAIPLNLDLSEFAGKTVTVRLTGDPGPDKSATFDWGRWGNARIERIRRTEGTLELVSPDRWQFATAAGGEVELRSLGANKYAIDTSFPSAVYMLKQEPERVSAPCDVTTLPFLVSFVSHSGVAMQSPEHAHGAVAGGAVGGERKEGFFTHPPNRGRTIMQFPVRLPEERIKFHSFCGLRDGSVSDGCAFVIEVNGEEVAQQFTLPGQWYEIEADLSPWAGKAVVISLIADSVDSHFFDWAHWGDPRLEMVEGD